MASGSLLDNGLFNKLLVNKLKVNELKVNELQADELDPLEHGNYVLSKYNGITVSTLNNGKKNEIPKELVGSKYNVTTTDGLIDTMIIKKDSIEFSQDDYTYISLFNLTNIETINNKIVLIFSDEDKQWLIDHLEVYSLGFIGLDNWTNCVVLNLENNTADVLIMYTNMIADDFSDIINFYANNTFILELKYILQKSLSLIKYKIGEVSYIKDN